MRSSLVRSDETVEVGVEPSLVWFEARERERKNGVEGGSEKGLEGGEERREMDGTNDLDVGLRDPASPGLHTSMLPRE